MQRDLERRRKSPWLIHLKPRQVGSTTYHALRLFWRVVTTPDFHGLIIAHEEGLPKRLLRMLQLAYDYLPDEFRPEIGARSGYEMTFPGLRSSLSIGTLRVQKKLSGAQLGRTYQSILITEIADPTVEADTINMLLQVVPYPEGEVVLDSTPKGRRGFFYRTYMDAKEGRGRFQPFFYEWWWEEGYTLAAPLEYELTDEERSLVARFHLTEGQIAWRRDQIETILKDPFRELYPENDIECWLFSGTPYFHPNAIWHAQESEKYAKGWPTWRGFLEKIEGVLHPHPTEDGPLHIYRLPEKGRWYILAADVAEGVPHGDYSAAQVLDYETLEQVAMWHGRITPDLFGLAIYNLGAFYNYAFIAVEANSKGDTSLTALVDAGYPHLYFRERIDPLTRKPVANKVGWLTGTKTKAPALHKLNTLLRLSLKDEGIVIHSRTTLDELSGYTYDTSRAGNKQFGAEQGAHDDTVDSLFIAVAVRESPQAMPPEDPVEMETILFEQAMSELGVMPDRFRHKQAKKEGDLEDWCLTG